MFIYYYTTFYIIWGCSLFQPGTFQHQTVGYFTSGRKIFEKFLVENSEDENFFVEAVFLLEFHQNYDRIPVGKAED